MFTDTHCHVLKSYYDDITEIINTAKLNGVDRIINCGCNNDENCEILNLIRKYKNMYGAIGIHPDEATHYKIEDVRFIEKNLLNPKILAIGEIGLDYHYGKDDRFAQIKLFKLQLKLAEKYNMPVIIHARDSDDDILSILDEFNVVGTIHSFSGNLEQAKKYINKGFLLGVNGIITFRNSNLKNIIKTIDINNLVLETDSPYLSPEPFRGHCNTPANIKYIAEFICKLYGITIKELEEITNSNFDQIYSKKS